MKQKQYMTNDPMQDPYTTAELLLVSQTNTKGNKILIDPPAKITYVTEYTYNFLCSISGQ
jgi:hypothetical protein